MLNAAQIGDILDIRRQLDELQDAPAPHAAFVATLRELTRTFQLERLRALLTEALQQAAAPQPAPETRPHALAALPAALRDRLRQAATMTDMDAVNAIIQEIRAIDAEGAERLARLAHEFEYGKIVNLLQS